MGADEESDVDPDAPWRPGYAGAPLRPAPIAPGEPRDLPLAPPDPWSRAAVEACRHPVVAPPRPLRGRRPAVPPQAEPGPPRVRVEGLPPNAVTGELVLGGVAVLAAIVVVVLVVRTLVVGGSADQTAFAVALPRRVELQWEREVASLEAVDAIGDEVVVARAGGRLIAFDRRTGEPRWERAMKAGAIARSIELVDDAVVVIDRLADGRTVAIALDAATGDRRWERSEATGSLVVVNDHVLVLTDAGGPPEVSIVDVTSGQPTGEAVEAAAVQALGELLASAEGGSVVLRDLDTLTPASPLIDADGLRSITVVGDAFIGFDNDNTIVAFDASGTQTDRRPFVSDAFGDFSGRAELVGAVPDHALGIVASGTSIGFRVVDGAVDVVWELDGRVGAPVRTDVGPVAVARVVDAATGEVDHAVLDARTAEILAITDRGVTRESDPILGRNGYLAAPEVGARVRELAAFGYDGAEWWRLVLPGQARYVIGEGAIVTVERDTGVLRLYR